MSQERLIIRSAYQRGWQVVANGAVIQTFAEQQSAFRFVVDRGARVHLKWGRMAIGGETRPFDFQAIFQQRSVGRIMREMHGPLTGTWFWSCYDGGARDTVATRDEAVAGVEEAYTERVAGVLAPR
ncbi:hypothetical protein [Mesorhizobium sp.]|uniref:hypothetical protein n=1 Tax=Mesorhizobium sp. TaxID=1871066 RepID=UPI003BA9A45D